jgi:hypothetical protein
MIALPSQGGDLRDEGIAKARRLFRHPNEEKEFYEGTMVDSAHTHDLRQSAGRQTYTPPKMKMTGREVNCERGSDNR